jgi:hypothetical protein
VIHPVECSDEFGLQGVKDAADFAAWFNSWMRDEDSTRCVIEKSALTSDLLDPENYIIIPRTK